MHSDNIQEDKGRIVEILYINYRGYDEYDSFVVVAKDEDEARNTNPKWDPTSAWPEYGQFMDWSDSGCGWARKSQDVKVTKIGVASKEIKGIVITSFNAG